LNIDQKLWLQVELAIFIWYHLCSDTSKGRGFRNVTSPYKHLLGVSVVMTANAFYI